MSSTTRTIQEDFNETWLINVSDLLFNLLCAMGDALRRTTFPSSAVRMSRLFRAFQNLIFPFQQLQTWMVLYGDGVTPMERLLGVSEN